VAQVVEHLPSKCEALSSNPAVGGEALEGHVSDHTHAHHRALRTTHRL
jgi:hypothetical protein